MYKSNCFPCLSLCMYELYTYEFRQNLTTLTLLESQQGDGSKENDKFTEHSCFLFPPCVALSNTNVVLVGWLGVNMNLLYRLVGMNMT